MPSSSTPLPAPSEPRRGLEHRVAFEAVRQRLFTTPTAPPAPPVTLGRFVVTHRVGQGGMGVVYAGYDPRLERRVALKVVRPLSASPSAQARLEREARAAASLNHPHVVTVYECGFSDGGAFFIAMEFVEGQTLRQWLEIMPRRWPEIVEMFVAAGRGLAAAHEAGIVHRDFKPDNVLVSRDGRARVADFGVARIASAPPTDRGSQDPATPDSQGETSTQLGGTPDYMAPEQRDGKAVGPAADQFALCVALHEALLGTLPAAPDARPSAGSPRSRRVPRALLRAVLRGLEPEPTRRHPSMTKLVARLEEPLRALRRRRWVTAGVLAAGLTGVVGHGLAAPEPIDPCANTDARMVELWSPERREGIATRLAILPAPLPTRTLTQLDSYADGWSRMRKDSCEATRVRGEQSDALLDLRAACLDRRAYALEGLLVRLEAGGGRGSIERLAALVPELMETDVCKAEIVRELQAAANMTRSRTDRTRSPEAEQAWGEVARQLEDAWLQAAIGDVAPAIAQLRSAEQLALAHELGQLQAEATVLRVHHQLALDPKADVRQDLERALEWAQAASASTTAVQCVAELLRLEREQPRENDDDGVSMLLAVGRGLAARTHDPPRMRARLAQQHAALSSSQGKRDEAAQTYRMTLAELDEAEIPADDSLVMGLQIGLGAALIEGGHYDEAEPVLLALWTTQRAVLPDQAFALAPTALQLGHVARRAGRLDEALERYQTAHAIFSKHWGPTHADTQQATLGLAKVEQQRGNLDHAGQLYQQVITSFEHSYGKESTRLLSPLGQLAELERERGHSAEAVVHATRATAVAEARLGATNHVTAAMRVNLGKALLASGDVVGATTQLTSAHDVLGEKANPEWRGEASLHLARALHASAASPERIRTLIEEARIALTSVAEHDVLAATTLDELRSFLVEAKLGTP